MESGGLNEDEVMQDILMRANMSILDDEIGKFEINHYINDF
jgi:hypothetical protein